MGWNEPPDKDKNPWGNRGNDGPPDLDELIRKMNDNLNNLFGGKRSKKSDGSNGKQYKIYALGATVLLLLWLAFDMVYLIDEQQRGVVLRFGQYVDTLDPGLKIRLPRPLEKVYKVNVGRLRSITHKALMLTQDENIIDVELAIQWRINDPTRFLFNVRNPEDTLRQVTESVVREVIGKSLLDFALTAGRQEIAGDIKNLIQQTLGNIGQEIDEHVQENNYAIGIYISSVEMQPTRPPDEVKAAFDDAIKAREDEQRLVNEAEAYRNDILPKARGTAARMLEEANAYKERVISKSEGEAKRFEQLLAEYWRAPEVTRERLYLDTMESVFLNTNKVFVDNDGGNSLMYLPIDKLLEKRERNIPYSVESVPRSQSVPQGSMSSGQQNAPRGQLNNRIREMR